MISPENEIIYKQASLGSFIGNNIKGGWKLLGKGFGLGWKGVKGLGRGAGWAANKSVRGIEHVGDFAVNHPIATVGGVAATAGTAMVLPNIISKNMNNINPYMPYQP